MVTPTKVPTVSKMSTNRNEKNTVKNWKLKILLKSKFQKTGAAGALTIDQFSHPPNGAVTPIGIPITVVIKIPRRIEPGTCRTYRIAVITRPMRPNKAAPEVTLPRPTNVAGLSTMISAFFIPINVMKRPIPAATAFFRLIGIDSTIASRTLKKDSKINSKPSRNTAVNAVAGEYFIPITTVYVKKAFKPMPGASATGRLASTAIIKVAIAADNAVAVNTLPGFKPASLKMSGLTARIYAIARNVVNPAMISVRTFVLCA